MRLEKAEKSYVRPFVRSSVPLFLLGSSLWQHPDQDKESLPIGYTLGVVWQEDYMKGKRGLKFNNANELLDAYNAGRLSGILIADLSVFKLVKEKKLYPRPIKKQTISTAPLYHYLGAEYAPFMDRLSNLLKSKNHFSEIQQMQE